jgi:tetratricopeptide (TPR) repeat protein
VDKNKSPNWSDVMTGGDWNDVYEEVEAEHFVGREQELESFHQHISLANPRYLIFYITGQGGAGKTTLLTRYKGIAQEYGFLVSDSDEQQRDVPTVLGWFAQQLTDQGVSFKNFDEKYRTYRQKRHEIENDPEAPQGLAATLARIVVRTAFISGDAVPGVRKGLEYIPLEAVETQASEWATYLAKKFSNKDDVALVRDPVAILTPLFFKDLNEVAQKRKVLLCFDTFEAASPELQEWLLRLREYKPSLNVRVVIAGRDQPGAKWDALRAAMLTIRLDVFKEQEAEMFLDVYGITSLKRRQEILELSGKLPVLMSWLAAAESHAEEADVTIPSHDVVDRFLRWVTDSQLRQVALVGAIPRTFNADILSLLLKSQNQTVDEQRAFDWLLTMPFIIQSSDGWRYHDVVRRMMLHYERGKSPKEYRQMHMILANFYNKGRNDISTFSQGLWINSQWRKATLAYCYHYLVADPIKHWGEVMSLFALAIRKRRTFAIEIVDMLDLDDVRDELTIEQSRAIHLFSQQLRAIREGNLQDGFVMFDKLCQMDELDSEAKGYMLSYRGECYQLNSKYEEAIYSFDESLRYLPENVETLTRRGVTYSQMERYEEALVDFNQAIALNEKYVFAFAFRGETYRRMERYEDALVDFNQAIALNEKYVFAFAQRSETYRQMERYEEALADINQAIALNEIKPSDWYNHRGLLLSYLGFYTESIESYEHALEKNPDSYIILYNIAVVMARWQKLPSAQKYIDEASAALLAEVDTDQRGAALYGLGGLAALEGRNDIALDYLQQAVSLEKEAVDWARHDIAWSDLRISSPEFQSLILENDSVVK